ncbi:MAG: hypothetical protein LC789_03545 [Actinobacteria bacterium]|nr:hypothetical protein [Actinomycetota bacterium]
MTSTSSRRRAATLAAGVVLALPVSSLLLSGTAYAEGATNTDPNPYAATASTGDNQGNGSAPANGTVGKADDMNPAGQAPGGSDANNGYECDNNNGVGDNGGNPAHTGCTTPTAPTSSTSDSSTATIVVPVVPVTPTVDKPVEKPVETVVTTDAAPVTAPVAAPVTAPVEGSKGAGTAVVETLVAVQGPVAVRDTSVIARSVTAPAAVLLPAAPTATALPFTGDRTGTQVELGLLMLAVGVGAVVVGRRTV